MFSFLRITESTKTPHNVSVWQNPNTCTMGTVSNHEGGRITKPKRRQQRKRFWIQIDPKSAIYQTANRLRPVCFGSLQYRNVSTKRSASSVSLQAVQVITQNQVNCIPRVVIMFGIVVEISLRSLKSMGMDQHQRFVSQGRFVRIHQVYGPM